MATKKRISELPESTDFKGLWTIGVNALNKSVKVSLEYISTKVSQLIASVNSVIGKAETATTSANSAASSANSAATKATTATQAANTAKTNADTATANANAATKSANDAAKEATEAATTATNAANAADAATQAANTAKTNADTATANANAATKSANDAAKECQEIIDEAQQTENINLVPTSMDLDYPKEITFGNLTELFIKANLNPASVKVNVLFLGDNKSISVTPDGRITVLDIGTSTIHVIPTGNTAIYRSIQIKVSRPTLRMVQTRAQLLLTGDGNLILN